MYFDIKSPTINLFKLSFGDSSVNFLEWDLDFFLGESLEMIIGAIRTTFFFKMTLLNRNIFKTFN